MDGDRYCCHIARDANRVELSNQCSINNLQDYLAACTTALAHLVCLPRLTQGQHPFNERLEFSRINQLKLKALKPDNWVEVL
jgi:hypothetical protein